METLWREALLVADQIVVLARSTLGTAGAPLWLVDVRLAGDALELARASGLPARSVRRSVDALISAEVLDGVGQIGNERVVRLRPETLTDASVLAAVRWDIVRELLADGDAPVARLVVRELARRTTVEARRQGHFVSASQRDLAEAVGYSKASMRRHLDALVAAGVIASRSRDRTNSWHRLAPIVFDGASATRDAAPRADANAGDGARIPRSREPAPARTTGMTSAEALVPNGPSTRPMAPFPAPSPVATDGGSSPSTSPSVGSAITAALTLEVNGVRVALPPGVELTLEQDEQGALWYRAGAVRLGPVRFG